MSVAQLLPPRRLRLRILAHTRRIVLAILPLGALVGMTMTFIMKGLESFSPRLDAWAGGLHLLLLLPWAALFLTTIWLAKTGIGEVSLFEDLDLAKGSPFVAFPFRRSLGKVIGCTFTIALGGSTGMEGPAKWLGAALGVQFHRLLRALSHRVRILRRLKTQPLTMVTAGASAAVAVVFRAPLSGALFAVEHDGHILHDDLMPSVIAAAAAYMVFAGFMGTGPLIPMLHTYRLTPNELFYALILGGTCGVAASLFLACRRWFRRWLEPVPFLWRGAVAGLGLVLLALPAHSLFHALGIPADLQVTQRGGLELVTELLRHGHGSRPALIFMSLKLLATALTLAGGGVGGMWLCTVAMGASLGAAFDAWLLPSYPGLLTILGGVAFAGAAHNVLLVPIVFLAETTAQASLVVPALLATTMALLVKREHDIL